MAGGANLPGLLSNFDARHTALANDIKNAQAEVARAQKAVSDLGVAAFGNLADKETVSDIVVTLNAAWDGAPEADRQEAARFQELRRICDGVTASQGEFLAAVEDAQQQSADFATKRDDLQKQI